MLQYIEVFTHNPDGSNPMEATNNAYELPSTERAKRHLHGAACFSTKSACFKSIYAGNYYLS